MEAILFHFKCPKYIIKINKRFFQAYDNISVEAVRKNLFDFIRQIAPIAESHGVFLAIHPDDPPIPLLGLPRIVSTALDVRKILGIYLKCIGNI